MANPEPAAAVLNPHPSVPVAEHGRLFHLGQTLRAITQVTTDLSTQLRPKRQGLSF